jgi:hypothetical protein
MSAFLSGRLLCEIHQTWNLKVEAKVWRDYSESAAGVKETQVLLGLGWQVHRRTG